VEKQAITLRRLQKALDVSEKREEHEQQLQDGLRKRIAEVIAKQRGLVIGKFYYVLPTNGQKPRKYRAEIVAFDRHWHEREAAKHISVLVKYYNRNGAFKTEWVTTEKNEFTPITEAQNK
jgi:hypothetical protein